MKRIFLFIATNIAVLVVIRVIFGHLGHQQYRPSRQPVGLFCSVGFSGSIVSLLMSKTIAKHSVGAVVIDQPKAKKKLGCWQPLKRKPANGI